MHVFWDAAPQDTNVSVNVNDILLCGILGDPRLVLPAERNTWTSKAFESATLASFYR